MTPFAVRFASGLVVSFFAMGLTVVQAQTDAQKTGAPTAGESAVRMSMRNVDFHLTDTIVVHIANLEGKLAPDHGLIPVFDDKQSFHLEVDSASIQVSTQALSNDLNDYVFAKPDAPLKNLVVTTQGNELILKGILASKGGIPFETDGTMEATPSGQIRVHTLKVKALHLPVKGLMDILGLDTANLIDTKKLTGIATDKDDLILDPQQILPPPKMHGHLTDIKIENGALWLVFASVDQKERRGAISLPCSARNFEYFKGGSVRFGKITMSDTDLELMDSDPSDPFDFSIDHYMEQLVAGYSKMTRQGALCVHLPDFNKLKHGSERVAK
jgi:hypothetical protein